MFLEAFCFLIIPLFAIFINSEFNLGKNFKASVFFFSSISKLIFELNGGIKTIDDCIKALEVFDGAMVGRAAYSHPYIWTKIDPIIFKQKEENLSRSKIIKKVIPFAQKHIENDGRLWQISKHLINLIEDFPNAKKLRKEFSDKCQRQTADISILKKIAQQLEDAGQ